MQIAIIILLALLCAWLGLRLFRLERGLKSGLAFMRGETTTAPEISLKRKLDSIENLHRLAAKLVRSADEESQERRFLQQLLDRLDDAFLVVDRSLKIQFANREAQKLFAVESPIGRQLIEVCVEHLIVDAVEKALTDGELVSTEILLSASNQVERTFALKTAPVGFENYERAWVVLRDRTLQRETDQIRRDFVDNAAHELRTPLSVIQGYLEMLDQIDDMQIPAQRAIEKMLRHSQRLSRLVDDMLTISRLESEPRLRRESFRLADCAADAIESLKPIIEAQQARVKFDFPDPEITINGDRFYWEQIFLNLLENALKYNQREGLKLAIRHRGTESEDIIEIRDNGVGIPKRDLAHVFERFYRVDKHHSQGTPGTGLGLSIVKRAVAAHGGEIRVESTPGIRTSFIITLGRRH
ncbi:MAG: two-component system phosphate regulon sensor histidine kinase PhoR [Verrucomicrobiales bacterium]